MKILAFDMDGTIANLYGVPNWLEKIRGHDVTPYQKAKLMYKKKDLKEIINLYKSKGYKVIVISWLPMNSDSKTYDREVRQAKKQWCEKHGLQFDYVHVVKYGYNKQRVLKRYEYTESILVDDCQEVRQAWQGVTINAKDNDIIQALKDYLQ